jgi:hypothetical protein
VNVAQKVMKWLAPSCEKQRQEFRRSMAAVNAHAEDLTRTLTKPIYPPVTVKQK